MLGYLDNCGNRMDKDLIIKLIARGVKNEMVRLKREVPLFCEMVPSLILKGIDGTKTLGSMRGL